MSADREVILIIDDNEENRYAFSRYLRKENFEIWTAKTGSEGLALAKKKPSLIMLDIQLPDTTGFELCQILKSDAQTSSIPVLHTSATFTENSDRAQGLEGGADGYLIQPIDGVVLTATVRSLLRVRTAEREARSLAYQWQTTFDSISDGLCVVSQSGNIERFNRAFAALVDRGATSVTTGVPFEAILRGLIGENAVNPEAASFELKIGGRWYKVSSNTIKNDEGEVVGTTWVFSDIDTVRAAEFRLQNLNQELEQRVAERTTSLQAAIYQLEQFSYAVSHDLRAPLRAMTGYSLALLEDYSANLPEEALSYLQRISTNATRLDKMIVDVLTFTKISKDRPVFQTISLPKLIDDVIEHYPGLKQPDAGIEVTTPHEVLANESGLIQALSNLLGNAVKFVKPGVKPHVKIWSEVRGENIRIWVEDNGIGIPTEYQKRLFGMFERVLPSTDYEGTGVGLAITRKIVERMNGTVGMESDGISGSKFWIELKQVH